MTTEDQLASEVAAWLCGHEGAKAIVVERTPGIAVLNQINPAINRVHLIVGCSCCGEIVGLLNDGRVCLFGGGDEVDAELGRLVAELNARPAIVHAHGTPHFVHRKRQVVAARPPRRARTGVWRKVTTGLNYRPLNPPDVTCPRCLEWIEQGRPMVVRD